MFGYYIEVSRSYAASVPDTFIRKQTLTTGERYITPELKELAREPSLMEWPAGMPPDAAKRMAAIMLEDVRAGRPDLWYAAHVGARAVDDHTLELAMRSPMPQLPLLLLHCTWFPVPRHAVEAHGGMLSRAGAWTRPGAAVGNGPFVMAEHRFNDDVEVRRIPRYRNAAAVRLNGVRFLPTVNGFTETRMFFNGKMHVTNNVPPEMTAYARERGGADFCQDDYYVTIFYRLNTGHGPLKDARVRKALSMAVDREAGAGRGVRGRAVVLRLHAGRRGVQHAARRGIQSGKGARPAGGGRVSRWGGISPAGIDDYFPRGAEDDGGGHPGHVEKVPGDSCGDTFL